MKYYNTLYHNQPKSVQLKLWLFWTVVAVVIFYMQDFEITKVLHFLGFISWFAGLFYLPRIFVYHVESDHEQTKKTFDLMAYKLYYFIMNPAKNITIISGLTLFYIKIGFDFSGVGYWFYIKVIFVGFLIFFHYVTNYLRQGLLISTFVKSSKFYRISNEIPTVLLMVIIIMIVYKFS